MENEYQNIRQVMRKQLKLSPYDLKQKLRLVIDGAQTAGTGFLLIQYVYDKDIREGRENSPFRIQCTTIRLDFSSMETEAIALDGAITACHYWLYYYPEIELISDCQGLLDLLD